jgi:hypothetical protein
MSTPKELQEALDSKMPPQTNKTETNPIAPTEYEIKLAKLRNLPVVYCQLVGKDIKMNGAVFADSKKIYRNRSMRVIDVRRSKFTVQTKKGTAPGIELLLKDGIHAPRWSSPLPINEEL